MINISVSTRKVINSLLFPNRTYIKTEETWHLPEDDRIFSCVRSTSRKLYDSYLYYCFPITPDLPLESFFRETVYNPVYGFIWPVDVILKEDGYYYLFCASETLVYRLDSKIKELNRQIWTENEFRSQVELRKKWALQIANIAVRMYNDTQWSRFGWRAENIYLDKQQDLHPHRSWRMPNSVDGKFPDESYYKDWCLYINPFIVNGQLNVEDPLSFLKFSNVVGYSPNTGQDCFNLAVLVFYILVGRFPYHGRMNLGMNFETDAECKQWNRRYCENAVFIFDEGDNTIGLISEENRYIQLWENLDADTKEFFWGVFCKESALKKFSNINEAKFSEELYSALEKWE